jgi:hypothetical protein
MFAGRLLSSKDGHRPRERHVAVRQRQHDVLPELASGLPSQKQVGGHQRAHHHGRVRATPPTQRCPSGGLSARSLQHGRSPPHLHTRINAAAEPLTPNLLGTMTVASKLVVLSVLCSGNTRWLVASRLVVLSVLCSGNTRWLNHHLGNTSSEQRSYEPVQAVEEIMPGHTVQPHHLIDGELVGCQGRSLDKLGRHLCVLDNSRWDAGATATAGSCYNDASDLLAVM